MRSGELSHAVWRYDRHSPISALLDHVYAIQTVYKFLPDKVAHSFV